MSNYLTVKAGISGRLNALGYVESSDIADFKNAAVNEYGNRFILKCLSGENQNNTILDRFDDEQVWQIQIAFERSDNNEVIQLDKLHIAKDAIIKDLDKPANWTSFVKMLKYDTCEVIELPNYFILAIKLAILDEYIHGV